MIPVGLIVNPVAGLGGSVGLKGTDGMVEEALRRGAEPLSNRRAARALSELLPLQGRIRLLTGGGDLGETCARSLGFEPEILYDKAGSTGFEDTRALARALAAAGVRLLLFAGGDGTAADIYEALGPGQAVLGIPAGVKIYSPVYARTPKAAGQLALLFLTDRMTRLEEMEVLDIDEDRYRLGQVDVRLRGYLTVPSGQRLMQDKKAPSQLSEGAAADAIAAMIIRDMEPSTCYLIGAGTTTRSIMDRLGLPNTLIGVDLILKGQLLAGDVYGDGILDLVAGRPLKLVLTVTGGQGFLLGRGNQQLTPAVLAYAGRDNLIIAATQRKLAALGGRPLLVDTGLEELEAAFSGYYRAISGFDRYTVVKVE